MTFQISQSTLSETIKRKIFDGFRKEAIKATGINGLSEEPVSFEIFNGEKFVGAIVVQLFWEQLHIKYLFVEENYRGQGIARQLMNYAFEYGRQRGCYFAFVETMSFQAPDFYQKMGFNIEFSRPAYAKNTTFHYLRKNLNNQSDTETSRQVIRVGVYGLVRDKEKFLAIRQKRGPYAGKFDFPGGGIEFSESMEQALRREFLEEVAMEFDSMNLIDNLSTTIQVTQSESNSSYTFHHIGMIYRVEGCRLINETQSGDLQHSWVNLKSLSEEECSALLWKYKMILEKL